MRRRWFDRVAVVLYGLGAGIGARTTLFLFAEASIAAAAPLLAPTPGASADEPTTTDPAATETRA